MDADTLEALEMTEDEWDELSPFEQATIEQTVGLESANQLPVSFTGSAMTPQMSPMNYDLTQAMGASYFPKYDKKGNFEPLDQEQAAQVNNLMQDQLSLYVDNVMSMLSGPGSYQQGAFSPSVKKGKTLPGRSQISALANNPNGGYRSLLAAEIKNGATPEVAMNKIWDALSKFDPNDKSVSEADKARVQSIIATLPGAQARSGTTSADFNAASGMAGAGGGLVTGDFAEAAKPYNADAILSAANKMFTDWNSEAGGWEDPESGQWYDAEPTETPTAVMKWYDKYGLPYPTASYGDEQYTNAAVQAMTGRDPAAQEQAIGEYATELQGIQGERQSAGDAAAEASKRAIAFSKKMDEYTKAHEKWQGEQQKGLDFAKSMNQPQGPVAGGFGGNAPMQVQPGRPGQPQGQGPVPQPGFPVAGTGMKIGGGGASMPISPPIPPGGLGMGPQPEAPFVFEGRQGLESGAYEDLKKKQLPEAVFDFMSKMPFGGAKPEGSRQVRRATQADVGTFKTQRDTANAKQFETARKEQQALYQDPRLDSLYAQVIATELAKKGRSPLKDALAQRSLGAAAMRGY